MTASLICSSYFQGNLKRFTELFLILQRAPHRTRLSLDCPIPSLLPHSLQVHMSTSITNPFHQNHISGSASGQPKLRHKPSIQEPIKSTPPTLDQDKI